MEITSSQEIITDEEIIYLCQNAIDRQKWVQYIYLKYNKYLFNCQKKIYYKFFYVPIYLEDLDFIRYLSVLEALKSYQDHNLNNFKSYLFKVFSWKVYNYILHFLSKHKTAIEYYDKSHHVFFSKLEDNYTLKILDSNIKKSIVLKYLSHLTPMEQKIYISRSEGNSINEIANLNNWNYFQVANGLTRAKRKLKTLLQ